MSKRRERPGCRGVASRASARPRLAATSSLSAIDRSTTSAPIRRRPAAIALLSFLLSLTIWLASGKRAYGEETEGTVTRQLLGSYSEQVRRLQGKPVVAIIVNQGNHSWHSPASIHSVRVGEPFSAAVGRKAARELLASGGFASVKVLATRQGDGVRLELRAVARRLVAAFRLRGSAIAPEELWRLLGLRKGSQITWSSLADIQERVRQVHARRGWPEARVSVRTLPTAEPIQVVLEVEVEAGKPASIGQRIFRVDRAISRQVQEWLESYDVEAGDRADEDALQDADHALEQLLRKRRYLEATVQHLVDGRGSNTLLTVLVHLGARTRLRFEGNVQFDVDELAEAGMDGGLPPDIDMVAERIRKFYRRRGWLDVQVVPSVRSTRDGTLREWVLEVREGQRVRVVGRSYPCLDSQRYDVSEIDAEIDAVLREVLPSPPLLQATDPKEVDEMFGPHGTTGARPAPLQLDPTHTYDPEAYAEVTKHLQDMFHSEGYLRARVLTPRVIRRACDGRGRKAKRGTSGAVPRCLAPVEPSCSADSRRCCSQIELSIPIILGPRAQLYDVSFRGNAATTNRSLMKVAALRLGQPVSNTEVEKARQRILEAYLEEGYAYARVQASLHLSRDGTRARVVYTIHESQQVIVDEIRVVGARRTSESLIRGRIALAKGQPYRRSLVRKTERRLGSLGVFTSVAVSLQDPHTPATHKTVLVQVRERPSQYLEIRPGFATGEGFRAQFEYGHLNIGGEAIQLILRARLSYLPDMLIQDPTLEKNLTALPLSERLERRNTATLRFPEIGLGPLISLSVTGVDARSNERDFGMTKAALTPMLHYRPVPTLNLGLGTSFERNDATVFGGETIVEYLTRPGIAPGLQQLLLVPDGLTYVFSQHATASWDIRDNSLDPTRGWLVQGTVEHVHAYPGEDALLTVSSDFLRASLTVSTYASLSKKGITLATRLRVGNIWQLQDRSATYPDRLFFLGGVDSLRGFQNDSLIPQDLADEIERTRNLPPGTPEKVTARSVAIRGGDAFINPRVELRFPLTDVLHSALFVDAGNLWREPSNVEPWRLRYTAGSGLRIQTPIGPIALDYGFNLMRRSWEDASAFHFSIGLF